jgi:uncharacterized protein (TIGR00730 family)
MIQRICVFCGSRAGARAEYADRARGLGELLAREKIGLVYGGGHIGLMGAIADAVLAAGGEVIGVIPKSLVDRELAHLQLTELRVVSSMHARKAEMEKLSDAFVSLPGAFGTADEMFEILTWAQLGLHRKPIGLLNVAGFFDPLLAWLDHAVAEGFLKEKHRRLLIADAAAESLLARLRTYQPPDVTAKWIDETQI